MDLLNITHLHSGGLITNYYCTSKCKHCLYGCSPNWEKKYIDDKTAFENLNKVKSLGCYSVHVGGGEPFLDLNGLKDTLIAAREAGVGIDYIETNSSWFKDSEQAVEILKELRSLGAATLLISMSPFHNEHIPFYKVKGVINACQKTGVSIFPWVEGFYNEINSFDDKQTHNLEEYADKFGENYILNIPLRYWIHYGGRVVHTYKKLVPLKDIEVIISQNRGCFELADTSHFHIDLFGNYIPGLCSGFAIKREDLGSSLNNKRFFFINLLYNQGIKGFYEFAVSNYNYIPSEDMFLNKCHLCFDIRKFLIHNHLNNYHEFQPSQFYKNI